MPKTDPVCSAKRRPKTRASAPTGSVPSHMPITMQVIGRVARPLSGASIAPTMLAVLTITVLLPPASACATASTMALRRARLSSTLACRIGSATADMMRAPGKPPLLAAMALNCHCRQCRAALSRTRRAALESDGPRVADRGLARLGRRFCADLAERGAQFVDVEVNELGRPVVAERSDRPQERLAGKSRIGAERERAHHVLPTADATVEHDGRPLADRRDDPRQAIDRRHQRLDLASAMVRHPDPVDAECHRLFGVVGVQDALHHHRTLPALAKARDFLPGKCTTHFASREADDVIGAGAIA